ncbi:unnamed protein product [Leuciscus chuanchicus]
MIFLLMKTRLMSPYPVLSCPIPPLKVQCVDGIISVRAAELYETCLRQLLTIMKLPEDRCTGVLRTGLVCDSVAPFHINITSKGTAMSAEWDTYCVDTVKEYWEERNSESICRLQGKDVVVLGDGRNDSPGHCAQYCSYTTMELDTQEIIHVAIKDKTQTSWNSNIMEKEGFIRTVDKLSREKKLVEICTDAHIQIGALMNPDKGRYKDLGIHHSLDMWHGAKNLAKKFAAAKVKGQSILLHWLKDIVNHFWWCCKTADTKEQFLDVHKYLRFRSTADLESFQNHVLMYASKRFAFTPPVYEARVLLAALDYNFHHNRPTGTTSAGKQMSRGKQMIMANKTPDSPKQTWHHKRMETPECSNKEEQPVAKKPKPDGKDGFIMGATADSDDEIFYLTVETNTIEPEPKEELGNSSSEKEQEKEKQE